MKYAFLFTFLIQFTTALFSQVNESHKPISEHEFDSLKNHLETILKKDQTFRRIYLEAEKILGKESMEMEYFWEVTETQDKVLEKEITSILDRYGWLGISQVGQRANAAQWAILQHGTIASKEKYAPLLKASVLADESQAKHYALLMDRLRFNSNKPQLYGTNIQYDKDGNPYFYEIESPELIDQRRKKIGLGPIKEYATSKNIEWKIPQL